MNTALELSVVIPVFNEEDNVEPLAREVIRSLQQAGLTGEILFVDDGSQDATAERAERVAGVRVIRHTRNLGQSAGLATGLRAARAPWILTLDGDGQNDPAALGDLWHRVQNGAQVAVGVRAQRRDAWHRRAASRMAWLARQVVLRDGLRDTGCALRLFPRDEALALPAFDGWHRVLASLLRFRGLEVAEVEVCHRPRLAGVSKYGNLSRGLRGILDLAGLWWLKRRLLRRDTH